jgi:hypothetical protein
MKKIKLFYYDIDCSQATIPLDDLLNDLSNRPLEDRVFMCGHQNIRLESIHKKGVRGQSLWLLRMSRMREDNWPGVASSTTASRDLSLGQDELLSEETSLLIDTNRNKMIIQYNHFGVRAKKVQAYLVAASAKPEDYVFNVVVDQNAWTKFTNKPMLVSVDAVIDEISPADIAYFSGTSIRHAIEESVKAQATKLRLTFSVNSRVKTNKLTRAPFVELFQKILRRDCAGNALRVSVKENEYDPIEHLDLLDALKVSEHDADQIQKTSGRRYSADHLNALLISEHSKWLNQQ